MVNAQNCKKILNPRINVLNLFKKLNLDNEKERLLKSTLRINKNEIISTIQMIDKTLLITSLKLI